MKFKKKYDDKKLELLKDLPPQLLLERSIIINSLDGVKKAIKDGASLNEEETIYTAALFGDMEIIQYLLDAGTIVTLDVINDIEHELIEDEIMHDGNDINDGIEYQNKEKNKEIINLISSYIKEEPKKKISKFREFFNKIK